jgi:hypothetical protein
MSEESKKFRLSVDFVLSAVLAFVNLALDQADIHIMLVSWLSVVACIVLVIDAVRRTEWAEAKGSSSRLVIAMHLLVSGSFIGFGVYLQIRKNSAESMKEITKYPLRVDSMWVNTDRMSGQTVRIVVNLTNVSGRVLRVKELGKPFSAVYPRDPVERAALEDKLWDETVKELVGKTTESQYPTGNGGQFDVKREAGPLAPNEAQGIQRGYRVIYFMDVIQDAETGENLVEFCSYVGRTTAISRCYKHNKP